MTTIKELHWSKHICHDREDRMMEILSTVGLGEIIVESPDGANKRCGTSTGCLLVITPDNMVITAYLMGFRQAHSLYNGHIPQSLYNQIEKNYLRINSMKGKRKYDNFIPIPKSKRKETTRNAKERRIARMYKVQDE